MMSLMEQINPNKSKLIILLVVLCVTVSSLASYLFVKSQISFKKLTISPAPLVQPKPGTIANWKTYKNTEFSFSLEYPPGLNISANMTTNGLEVSFDPKNPDYPKNIFVSVSEASNNLSAKVATVKTQIVGHVTSKIDRQTDIFVGSKSAIRVDYSIVANNLQRSNVFLINGKYLYALSADHNLMDRILSTFKFLDQTQTDMANWKKYIWKNITFSYPNDWQAVESPTHIAPASVSDIGFKYKKEPSPFSIHIGSNLVGAESVDDYIKYMSKWDDGIKSTDFQSVNVDGQIAKKASMAGEVSIMLPYRYVILMTPDKKYVFEIYYTPSLYRPDVDYPKIPSLSDPKTWANPQKDSILDQILSTFKFTDSNK
jgi:hypothetical protein